MSETMLTNEVQDENDGYLNRLVLMDGVLDIKYTRKAIKLTITTADCTGVGTEKAATVKLPAGAIPDDAELAPGDSYALVLVRIRD